MFKTSGQQWDTLNEFAGRAGWQMMFDLNVLLRRDSVWDSRNARTLLNYTINKGYSINLQLGNGKI